MLPPPATVIHDLNPGTEARLALLELDTLILTFLLRTTSTLVGRNFYWGRISTRML